MKRIIIIFLLSFFICIPASFASTKIKAENCTVFWDISPLTTEISLGYSSIIITTPFYSSYFLESENNEYFNIHHIFYVPYNVNSKNFLNEWENNIKNKFNNIIYIEKIPIKNGIIYITKNNNNTKEVHTYYYKNGRVYSCFTSFYDSSISLNQLKDFAYKAIESIYPN